MTQWVSTDQGAKDVSALMKQWPQRRKAMMREILFRIAQITKDGVSERLPATGTFSRISKALRIVEVVGLPDGEAAFAVILPSGSLPIKSVDLFTRLRYIRPKRRGVVSKPARKKAEPSDLGNASYRLEFGVGGIKTQPHWKPAVRMAATIGLRSIARDKSFVRTLTGRSFFKWREWPGDVEEISVNQTKSICPFQSRLGIRL